MLCGERRTLWGSIGRLHGRSDFDELSVNAYYVIHNEGT